MPVVCAASTALLVSLPREIFLFAEASNAKTSTAKLQPGRRGLARPSTSSQALGRSAAVAGLGLASLGTGAVVLSRHRRAKSSHSSSASRPSQRVPLQGLAALSPEMADLLGSLTHAEVQDWWHAAGGPNVDVAELASNLQHWADALAAGVGHAAGRVAHDLLPPAMAVEAPPPPTLDPNVKYLMGVDGNVLIDPMGNKPLVDDWWNGFIGLQTDVMKAIDVKLREAGVEQAFGWTIVLYTLLVKLLFYPLQQSQLRSTSMMQLLSPKVKEIQAKFKDDPETMQRMMGQLYSVMDVNPLGGCVPVLLQLPIYWSLYGVWRRLYAEKFPNYSESWLWVPKLSEPNPDFQFRYDWLFQFKDGAPEMGWHDYLCYLVFPALLVGFTVIQQNQSKPSTTPEKQDQQLILQILPWISIYFIGSLSLQLPQAVSVYYAANTALTVAQTAVVKFGLRKDIPGYEEFEKTGKFPDGALDDMVRATAPEAKTLHEAALRGDVESLERLSSVDGGPALDIDAWDEKEIPPLGYAVACGHMDAVRWFIARGANLQKFDGADNSFLHYASGYGHLEVLKELITVGELKGLWPANEWTQWKNRKDQTVMDAARVNRKGAVLDWLRDRLGLEMVPQLPEAAPLAPALAQEPAPAQAVEAPAVDAEVAKARAVLLAATGTVPPAPGLGSQKDMAVAMESAVARFKSNPKALEEAKKMMDKMPPQLISMLTGGKLSAEQAKKAMSAMADISTDDLLRKAELATQQLNAAKQAGLLDAQVQPPAASAPAAPRDGAAPARTVD